MTPGIVLPVVDSDDDVECAVVLDRGGDDDALHAAIEIGLQLLGFQELAGALENDVAAEIPPWDIGRHRLGTEAEILAANRNGFFAVDLEGRPPGPMDTVEFEKVCDRRGAAPDFVQVHDLEAIAGARIVRCPVHAAQRRTKRQPAHPAHAVDANPHVILRYAGAMVLSPSSSRRFLSAIRSSEA